MLASLLSNSCPQGIRPPQLSQSAGIIGVTHRPARPYLLTSWRGWHSCVVLMDVYKMNRTCNTYMKTSVIYILHTDTWSASGGKQLQECLYLTIQGSPTLWQARACYALATAGGRRVALNTGDNLDLEILHDLEKLTVLPLGKMGPQPPGLSGDWAVLTLTFSHKR